MTPHRSTQIVPELVCDALRRAREVGFEISSTLAVGRLLRVLAGGITSGTIAEIGTGTGVGAAWIADGLQPGVRFVTIELDPDRAAAAQRMFAPCPQVEVLEGDWHDLLAWAPFAMLFADGGKSKVLEPHVLVDAMARGGVIVLDDLTPEDLWPDEWRGQPDPVREYFLNDERLNALEIRVDLHEAAIIATRRS